MKKVNCTAMAVQRSLVACTVTCMVLLQQLQAQTADTTLKGFSPFPFGASIGVTYLKNDTNFRRVLSREFNSVTAEGSMKMGSLHPQENTYFWTNADTIVNYAVQHNQRIHGHTLVWHNILPDWVTNFVGDSTAWENMLKSHIQTVVGRYKGRIRSWDVVNEAIDSDGTYRNTIWLQHLGPGYIARSFRYAHEADTSALLFYNDYGHEVLLKLNAIRKLCDSLKNNGVPIHGAGLQMHITKNMSTTTLDRAIDTMMKTNLLIHVSELTVAMNQENNPMLTYTPLIADLLAQKYKFMARTVKRIPAAQFYGITTWNISDKDTYMKSKYGRDDWPMPFDTLYQKKLAYQYIKDGVTQQWNFKAADCESVAGIYTDLGNNGTAITTNFAGGAITYDNDNSAPQNIGFSFHFNGTAYSQFVLNTNGIIKLGRSALPDTVFYSTATGVSGTNAVITPYIDILYPFNHDLKGTDSSEYRVYTSGTAGSRVCTIQYKNVSDKAGVVQYANMNFQVKLYESTGVIEFVYGRFTSSGNAATSITAVTGIRGINPAESVNLLKSSSTAWSASLSTANNYYFLDSNYLSSSSFRFNSRNNVLPDLGRTLRFSPASSEVLRSATTVAKTSVAPDTRMALQATNPFKGIVYVTVRKPYAGKLMLVLLDMNGRPLLKKELLTGAGVTTTTFSSQLLATGMYHLMAVTEREKTTVKLVKL